ncbi:MAG: restriction endonuclease subunit S, partial [Candidatus Aenigmarchaeota archaeon]|nr:restriction endonuclease subunit S [Candidatus Aenigmarchaeota archaeon]
MKQTEKIKFADFVNINPKNSLKKGTEYPFIEMQDIVPGHRYISSIQTKKFKGGGATFKRGDVLFARITPCLENGKIAQVKNISGDIGFGSTEFVVFRKKEEVSNSAYVYYLSISDGIRKPAEKSMYGASGRQRADLDVIKNIVLKVPSLSIQQKIVSILSTYDDLIENNNRKIKILEEMAQTIYSEWFVKFRFPGHIKANMVKSELGEIPEGWSIKQLNDIIDIQSGFAFKSDTFIDDGKYGLITIKNVQDGRFVADCDSRLQAIPDKMPGYCLLKDGDILLSLTGNVGRVCLCYGDHYLLNQRVAKLVPKTEIDKAFSYFMYFQSQFRAKLENISTGVAQQNLSPI